MSFSLYHDRLLVDCNEDGLPKRTSALFATLGIAPSLGLRGSIGEKGIGFKQTFLAAWEVHI